MSARVALGADAARPSGESFATRGHGVYRLLSSNVGHFTFTGSARGYFRVWAVNFALTVLTLGVYSAWASVRARRYFASHTMLADAPFACLASPWHSLATRAVLALAVLAEFAAWWRFGAVAGVALTAALLAAAPWGLRWHLKERCESITYDGQSFSFHAGLPDIALLMVCCSALLAFFPLSPVGLFLAHRVLADNTHFGQEAFRFHNVVARYYEPFAVVIFACLGLLLMGYAAYLRFAGEFFKLPGTWSVLIALALLATLLWAVAYVQSSVRNLWFDSVWLSEQHRFQCSQRSMTVMWLLVSGWLATLCSLGLMWPWFRVRMARYRAERLVLLPHAARDAAIAAYQDR